MRVSFSMTPKRREGIAPRSPASSHPKAWPRSAKINAPPAKPKATG